MYLFRVVWTYDTVSALVTPIRVFKKKIVDLPTPILVWCALSIMVLLGLTGCSQQAGRWSVGAGSRRQVSSTKAGSSQDDGSATFPMRTCPQLVSLPASMSHLVGPLDP